MSNMSIKESGFVKTFGDYPLIHLLDFFLTFREFDYSLSDISKNAEIGWTTTLKLVPILKKRAILKETRKVGKARMFQLNESSPETKTLIKIYNLILKQIANKSMEVEAKA